MYKQKTRRFRLGGLSISMIALTTSGKPPPARCGRGDDGGGDGSGKPFFESQMY
jgi:hypothetical protein